MTDSLLINYYIISYSGKIPSIWNVWHHGDTIKKILPLKLIRNGRVPYKLSRDDQKMYSKLQKVIDVMYTLCLEYKVNNITSKDYFANMNIANSNDILMKCYEILYKKYILRDMNSSFDYAMMEKHSYTTIYNYFKKIT
jgi:hypothetical protein